MKKNNTNAGYRERLHRVIPGGAHTYSKGDDQHPSNSPAILSRGNGCYVWDSEGNKYLDYGMALRAVTVGYGYEPIVRAAMEGAMNGNNLARPVMVELEAAELLTEITGTDMVKFAKNGSAVTTAALKLARAYTGKKYVAICAQHPFFSYDDWFIGTTPIVRGIPEEHFSLTLKFDYNDIASLKKLFDTYPGQIAAVMLEPATLAEPKDNFLHKIKALCQEQKSVFILDEMITGFRWHLKGAQEVYNIQADLVTYGKAMANGFSVAALAGKKEIMGLGGILEKGAERVFLISTTHGAEMCGLGAFIKTMEVCRESDVPGHLNSYGKKLIAGINEISNSLGIGDKFYCEGVPCSPGYAAKDSSGNPSPEFRTLFAQEMIKNKVMMPWIALSLAHSETELDITLSAVQKSLQVYKQALENNVRDYLVGEAVKPVFRKFN